MPVVSKMTRRTCTAGLLLGGAAFLAPQSRHTTAARSSSSTASSKTDDTAGAVATVVASTALGTLAAASSRAQTGRRCAGRTARKAAAREGGLRRLASVVEEKKRVKHLPRLLLELSRCAEEELQRSKQLTAPAARAFAEVLSSVEDALRGPADAQLRWAASSAAALLMSYVVTLQPAQAADVVNYSDFMESINRGEVEMVRVQEDMLSAQYTTKDCLYHRNLQWFAGG
eukprot:g26784.t1